MKAKSAKGLVTDPSMKRNALGKGLGLAALVPTGAVSEKGLIDLDLEKVIPNRYQPREVFDKEAIEKLTESITEHGVIQPIMVRKAPDGRYELISGERRFRAAKQAGLSKIPAIVKEIEDQGLMEWAVIENLQREDLNPLEKAKAYEKLIAEFSLTQADIAKRMGIDRSSVANFLRLLSLPTELWEDVAQGRLSMGHAKALLSLEAKADRIALAETIKAQELTVRQAERAVQRMKAPAEPKKRHTPLALNQKLIEVENHLRESLGTRVKFVQKGKAYEMRITIHRQDELDTLIKKLS